MIQDVSRLPNEEQLLSHHNQSRVLFLLTFVLSSMMQVKLMNVNISFTSLYTIAFRLIAIQVLRSYLLGHLDSQTMYNLIYLGVFRFINMGFATIFLTFLNLYS